MWSIIYVCASFEPFTPTLIDVLSILSRCRIIRITYSQCFFLHVILADTRIVEFIFQNFKRMTLNAIFFFREIKFDY